MLRSSLAILLSALVLGCSAPEEIKAPPIRAKVAIPRDDGTEQPAFVITPEGFSEDGGPYPLLVSLHSWSYGYEQEHQELQYLAQWRGWIYLFPDFRGPNDDPDATGSEKAQQDILDAVAWAKENYPIDAERIYLTGSSGGGHMALMMAGRHPEVWTAVSAWVPITDLAAWHQRHADVKYGEMMRASTGGAPGDSPEVDEAYRKRSPLTWLGAAEGLPIDIGAGIKDGHDGSVPIRHSLEAFNVLAELYGAEPITEAEIEELSAAPDARLSNPKPSDQAEDKAFEGRAIHLRRHAGPSRVTIFEGGHEGVATAAVDFLSQFPKD